MNVTQTTKVIPFLPEVIYLLPLVYVMIQWLIITNLMERSSYIYCCYEIELISVVPGVGIMLLLASFNMIMSVP